MELLVLFIPLALILILWFLALISKEGRAIGLVEGKLAHCTGKPNCICTEYSGDAEHYVSPLKIPSKRMTAEEVSNMVIEQLKEMGGDVQIISHSYISAIFETPLLGFVDDFEVRIDIQLGKVFFRSASRVGYSDLGTNRKRVKRVTQLLDVRLQAAM